MPFPKHHGRVVLRAEDIREEAVLGINVEAAEVPVDAVRRGVASAHDGCPGIWGKGRTALSRASDVGGAARLRLCLSKQP